MMAVWKHQKAYFEKCMNFKSEDRAVCKGLWSSLTWEVTCFARALNSELLEFSYASSNTWLVIRMEPVYILLIRTSLRTVGSQRQDWINASVLSYCTRVEFSGLSDDKCGFNLLQSLCHLRIHVITQSKTSTKQVVNYKKLDVMALYENSEPCVQTIWRQWKLAMQMLRWWIEASLYMMPPHI